MIMTTEDMELIDVNQIFIKELGDEELSIIYSTPLRFKRPIGFNIIPFRTWNTMNEMIALNHYRKVGVISTYLRRYGGLFPEIIPGHPIKDIWDKRISYEDLVYSMSGSIESNIDIPPIIRPTFIPRPHQLVTIDFGNLVGGDFIIADQQRTGKTYSALLYVLTQGWSRVLIMCPAKLVLVWKSMINTICDIRITILKSGDFLMPGFNIVSYDTLHTINDRKCDIAIADECHYFINDDSRRSYAVFSIKADQRIALSGTPILNNIGDILRLIKWVKPSIYDEIFDFADTIIITEKERLTPYEITRTISTEIKRRILLLRETYQVGKALDPYINYIEVDVNVEDSKNLVEVGKQLGNYAVEYLNSFDHQIVIMVYYKEVGGLLKARLGSNAILINGENSSKEVLDAIESFRNGDVQFLIGSTVLSEGIDLSFCNHMLIIEESYSIRTDQIRERISSINKTDELTIDILIAKRTQDERKYEILDDKYSLQHGLRDA